MEINQMTISDIPAFLRLAKEVEYSFGFSIKSSEFKSAVHKAIAEDCAFIVRDDNWDELCGVILISYEKNSIEFLTVAEKYRGMGIGEQLLEYVLEELDEESDVNVITFDYSVPFGKPARKLYEKAGFVKIDSVGVNPAGFQIMSMAKKSLANDYFLEAFKTG